MNFTLNRKTEQQIEAEKSEDRYYAKMVKGELKDICPLSVTLKTGKTIDAWDFDEQSILNLVEANMMEMTDKGMKNPEKSKESIEIINCWHQKHEEVSVDFIEGYYGLKDKYQKHQSVVDDFMIPLINKKVGEAQIIANYLNGMQGDKKEITSKNIIKILRNQEMIAKNRKEFNDSKKI